jgi:SAM-dependent methyltransferase
MADTVRPFCGQRVLEIGGGVGNLTMQLVPRTSYLVSDINPLYLTTLESLRSSRPYLSVEFCDVSDAASFPSRSDGFDTVICLNVIEHIKDDVGALGNIGRALGADGRAIVLVPHGPWNFGTLDEVLGHERRYTPASLTAAAEAAGLQVERIVPFNRISSLAWFLNGKIMRRRSIGLLQIKLLGLLTPIMRAVDPILPLPPLSLIAILKRRT